MENPENDLVMYFVVNKDLEMSVGKTATQVAHSMIEYFGRDGCTAATLQEWYEKFDQKKIVLKEKESKIKELAKAYAYAQDLGLTEIPKDSITCVCLGIMKRKDAEPITKRMRLL